MSDDYQVADSTAYVTLVTAQGALDKGYWLLEANSLAAAANVLATSSDTPWASYNAAEVAQYQAWVASAAPAQEQQRVTAATAQATAGPQNSCRRGLYCGREE